MIKIKSLLLSSIIACGTITNVQASNIDVIASISGTSNYISRGMTQSNDKGAVFVEGTVLYGGFFGGLWASNVEFEGADADSEIDLYLGYATVLGNLETSLSYTRFLYPNSNDIPTLDEVAIELVYPIDKLSIGGKYIWGVYTENDGEKYDYYEGFASYDFDILKLNSSAGSMQDTGDNFTIGISKDFEISDTALNLDLSYTKFYDDNTSSNDQENVYATITYAF
ncbi:TorF family putative porin [Poseidonibacter antarcticus]|uniref:TorF family putative porin n=1 Tax=Poseidonibacter antarcticus TaxID=2478538 RepID=UPI000EF521F6|nr:TorF family putative porin [Poseidonibacter antarcticus]